MLLLVRYSGYFQGSLTALQTLVFLLACLHRFSDVVERSSVELKKGRRTL